VLLKGVLHPDDARQAAAMGVAGLIVSNHGGRTLDTAVATAHALPRIVQAWRAPAAAGGWRHPPRHRRASRPWPWAPAPCWSAARRCTGWPTPARLGVAHVHPPAARRAGNRDGADRLPHASKRMGEQGKVVLRVLIGTDGLPQKVEINKSSGYDRLDRQAQEAVMRWRFVPGKRNGVPEAMWSLVPINFVLE
jgi:TonB family protein